ncbi:hypothetical protein Hypma_004162 [Hypsizygus marmoreus]|uniref:Uncharacterized protein n=1 Tax=Hypsizygus marmoreus TaxID=39966 RepID=A0A369J515_HYPMA|nr:hypothetical protein Hypma_004162 [Hypsizygus marmoreus]
MPSPPWTTPEQFEFLHARMADYLAAQKGGDYSHFWAALFEDWATEYSEGDVLFPGRDKSDYSPEEESKLTEAIEMRQGQLRTWFRWRTTVKARTVGKRPKELGNLLGGRTRLPHKSEIYSKLCYEEKIKGVVKSSIRKDKIHGRGKKLSTSNAITKRLWDAEEDESIRAEVEARLTELREAKKGLAMTKGPRTPDQYMKAIEDCPRFLGRYLNALAEKTGWAFSVLMGGPDPSMNGDINVASFHVGETASGAQFAHAHQGFETVFMEPYTEFLLKVFPPDIRRSRALGGDTEENSGKDDGGEVEEEAVELNLLKLSDLDEFGLRSDASPKTSAHPAVDALPHATPVASSSSEPNAEGPGMFDMSFLDGIDDYSSFFAGIEQSASSSVGPDNFDQMHGSSLDHDWMQTDTSGFFAMPNDPLPPFTGSTGFFGLSQPNASLFDLPSFDPNAFAIPSSSFAPSEFSFGDVAPLSIPGCVPPPPADPVSLSPLTIPNFGTIVPPIPSPITTLDVPLLSNTLGSQILPQSSTTTIPSPQLHIPPQPVAPPVAPPAAPPAVPLAAPLAAPPAAPPLGDLGQPRSRSGRHLIPSTRAEKMNKIGSSNAMSLDPANKENIPPAVGHVRPDWVLAAEAHLTTRDMGEEWANCVKAWGMFEDALEKSSKSKGALPSTKCRPEEWAKWVAKGRHGVRAYDTTPTIQDPVEFGLAIMAWWKSMQPAFRESNGGLLPQQVYAAPVGEKPNEDAWAPMRKGGPNGMVSVMTLLVWWGQRLKSGSPEGNSEHWQTCVNDVCRCLEAMMPANRKRAAIEGAGGPSKR